MQNPRAMVITGDGINCENETVNALRLAGFETSLIHLGSLAAFSDRLDEYHALVLPGGFSFGDEVRSGKILSLKLQSLFKDRLQAFIDQGKLLIGICNGFQALVQMGLLPATSTRGERLATLARNSHQRFVDRWVEVKVSSQNPSLYFEGLENFDLPIRHGEGRLLLRDAMNEAERESIAKAAPLRYAQDVNGSWQQIAALTNKGGNVIGLMPHPECFIRWSQHPDWTRYKRSNRGTPPGLLFFQNAAKMAYDLIEREMQEAQDRDKINQRQSLKSYRDAGVDVQGADAFVGDIKKIATQKLAQSTMLGNFDPDRMLKAAGGYASVYKIDEKQAVAITTDGVGTKLMLCHELSDYSTIGIDLVAMCANDLICTGARPALFLDYYAMGKLNRQRGKEIISGISDGLAQAGMFLAGGETAEMPDLYRPEDFDLAGFAVGFVDPAKMITGHTLVPGHHLIGIASSGIHSNGLSLARKLIVGGSPQRRALLTPTRIYVAPILAMLDKYGEHVSAIANITGGGFTNLMRFNSDVGFKIDNPQEPQEIFKEIARSIDMTEMYQTFNMGTGMIVAVKNKLAAQNILDLLRDMDLQAQLIGESTSQAGRIEINVDSNKITLTHAKKA